MKVALQRTEEGTQSRSQINELSVGVDCRRLPGGTRTQWVGQDRSGCAARGQALAARAVVVGECEPAADGQDARRDAAAQDEREMS